MALTISRHPFVRPGPTQELVIYRDKRPLRRVYYRVAYGYNPV